MKILSLFDGISCGYEALLEAGIPIEKYYASEIDKYAIKVATTNHPDIEEIGDVTQVKGEDYIGVDMVIGGSPCFTKGTKVWTLDGYKDISEIEVGDYVIGLNGEYNQVLKTGGESKEIWSIKGQGFLETLTTENHPYYVSKCKRVGHCSHRELQEPKWTKVKDIENGDYVGLPIIHTEENIKGITLQEAWLLGRYMADGHTRKDYRKNRKGGESSNRYWTVIYSIGNSKLNDFSHITEYHIGKRKHSQSTYRFVINSKRLVELCEDIGCGAINKSIPIWILHLPKNLLLEFFKGYMSGDGFYRGNGVRRCSTISKKMAMSLCLLSAKLFNTGAQIHFCKKAKTHTIQGRIVNQNDCYEVGIREYRKPQDHYMVTYDYIWFPVKEVKPLGYEDIVYNLEVENTNSYTANNIVVHNCTGFSLAGKQLNFNDPQSKLFFEYLRILKEVKPKYFLLENVKMKKEYQDKITELLWGITPTMIDSALLTAQRRKRNYWVGELQEDGTYKKVDIPQPEDKGILLKDILLEYVEPKYDVSEKHTIAMQNARSSGELNIPSPEGKCGTLIASYYKIPQDGPYILKDYYLSDRQIDMIDKWKGYERPLERVKTPDDKMDTLTTHCGKMSNGIKLIKVPCATQLGNGYGFKNAYGSDKAYTLRACQPNGVIESVEPPRIRKLHPIECERLQGISDNYTNVEKNSDTQRYKQLGNGWTVPIIAHIFTHMFNKNA